ncbi:MAG: GNAT family N-acetyltransferase [Chitinivibrionales bacterium]|nr:GNAT family N-acetyltransferase [Chitinivibrionales bacterium]
MEVTCFKKSELTIEQSDAIAELQHLCFHSKPEPPNPRKQDFEFTDEPVHFTIWNGSHLLAHAMTFLRIYNTVGGPLRIMALRGVCVLPEKRGSGLGAEVVKSAFARIDGTLFCGSIFQTRAPDFYQKLGARLLTNRFVNSRWNGHTEENPWWNPYIMAWPATMQVPDGTIDLNGPGY